MQNTLLQINQNIIDVQWLYNIELTEKDSHGHIIFEIKLEFLNDKTLTLRIGTRCWLRGREFQIDHGGTVGTAPTQEEARKYITESSHYKAAKERAELVVEQISDFKKKVPGPLPKIIFDTL